MSILDELRLAWARCRFRRVSTAPVRPQGDREPLSPTDLADLRRLDPCSDLYSREIYELPTGEVRIELTNTVIQRDNGLEYRLVRVHGDTFKPRDGREPPRELLARLRHSNTDYRDASISVVFDEQYKGCLLSIGVFGLVRD